VKLLGDDIMKPFENFDWKSFWDNSDGYTDDYTGKAPTDQEILDIEKETGYKLPESYIELIKRQNGGIPVNNVVTTDNVCINLVGIYGIDKDKEYSVCGDLGTDFWLKEWGYPSFGPVIADTISGGHDMIFLDYSECGPEGEPMVVLVDQEDDYSQEILADNFEKFIYKLESDRVITDIEEFKQLDAEKQVLALKKIRNMKGSRDMIELLEQAEASSYSEEVLGMLASAYNNVDQEDLAIQTLDLVPEANRNAMWYYRYGYSYALMSKKADNTHHEKKNAAVKNLEKAIELAEGSSEDDVIDYCMMIFDKILDLKPADLRGGYRLAYTYYHHYYTED
jgi:hypothetical protein